MQGAHEQNTLFSGTYQYMYYGFDVTVTGRTNCRPDGAVRTARTGPHHLLDHRLLHGLDDALFDHHAGLGCALEGLLRRPFRADGKAQGPFVLLF